MKKIGKGRGVRSSQHLFAEREREKENWNSRERFKSRKPVNDWNGKSGGRKCYIC